MIDVEVRKMVLLAYRDTLILPRHEALKTLFSRLSLDRIQLVSGPDSPAILPQLSPRPGTAGSASLDPFLASFNSQSSTLLSSESGARSRATSNTSAPELPPFSPSAARRTAAATPPAQHSDHITQTVGRMLQCMSVLASLRSGDDAQRRCEDLVATLKVNWLGRGRTGRQRKGFVGARVPARAAQGVRVGG